MEGKAGKMKLKKNNIQFWEFLKLRNYGLQTQIVIERDQNNQTLKNKVGDVLDMNSVILSAHNLILKDKNK